MPLMTQRGHPGASACPILSFISHSLGYRGDIGMFEFPQLEFMQVVVDRFLLCVCVTVCPKFHSCGANPMPFPTAGTPKWGAAEKLQFPWSLCHRLAFQGASNQELPLASEVHCFSNYLLVWGGGGSWEEDEGRMEGGGWKGNWDRLGCSKLEPVFWVSRQRVFSTPSLYCGDEPRGLAELYEPKRKLSCWNRLCTDEKGKCTK